MQQNPTITLKPCLTIISYIFINGWSKLTKIGCGCFLKNWTPHLKISGWRPWLVCGSHNSKAFKCSTAKIYFYARARKYKANSYTHFKPKREIQSLANIGWNPPNEHSAILIRGLNSWPQLVFIFAEVY